MDIYDNGYKFTPIFKSLLLMTTETCITVNNKKYENLKSPES